MGTNFDWYEKGTLLYRKSKHFSLKIFNESNEKRKEMEKRSTDLSKVGKKADLINFDVSVAPAAHKLAKIILIALPVLKGKRY